MRNPGLEGLRRLRGLSGKALLALGAAALPALLVAAMLGITLVTAVTHSERDFENSTSAARRLTQIRVLLEREHGLVARIPAELDLQRVDQYAREAAKAGHELDAGIAALAANARIVSADVAGEIRATRDAMKRAADSVIVAAKSFAQTTALETVNGPFEEANKLLITFLDAVGSNVDGVAERARSHLQASSLRAWRLTPVALVGALAQLPQFRGCAGVFSRT